MSIGLSLFFCLPYFALQRFPIFPVRQLPLSFVDRAIAFEPSWVWLYQSAYLLLSVVPWMSESVDDLMGYARGFVWLSAISFLCFLLMPIEAPRPIGAVPTGMFRLLVSYDSPLNCFPSLHVGLSVYTALFAASVWRDRRPASRAALAAMTSGWTAAIAYSALASKQHYAVDLPAGAALAWACHAWTRNDRERSVHAEAIPAHPSAGSLDPVHADREGIGAASFDASQPAGGGRP